MYICYWFCVYQRPDVMYNKLFKALFRTKYNECISTELIKGNLNIGDKYKISRDDLINFICQTINELNKNISSIETNI